jgi:hypothetical protein
VPVEVSTAKSRTTAWRARANLDQRRAGTDKRPPRQSFHKALRLGIRPPTSNKRSEATAASGFESRARSADGSLSEMNRAHNSGQLLSVVEGDVAIQLGATNLRERTDHGGH